MTRDYIAFEDEHTEQILNGDKYETVRCGWDDYPKVGDLVDLRDENRDVFAEAEIADVRNETIHHFANRTHHGHRNYEDSEEMVEHLNEYYSDEMDEGTIITVITFDVKHER